MFPDKVGIGLAVERDAKNSEAENTQITWLKFDCLENITCRSLKKVSPMAPSTLENAIKSECG